MCSARPPVRRRGEGCRRKVPRARAGSDARTEGGQRGRAGARGDGGASRGRGNGGPGGMRAFAGRALAGLSSIRACVRRSGDSSAGSAGLSTSSPPARAAKMMPPEGRLPLRAGTARLGRVPRTGTAGTAPTSPGWPRSGNWSLPPIQNSRNAFPATYPRPNELLCRPRPAALGRAAMRRGLRVITQILRD